MTPIATLRLHLDALTSLTFLYDEESDIASVFIGKPRDAITEEAGGGWYLRESDGEVSGLELHGLVEHILIEPFYADVTTPVLRELEAHAGHPLAEGLSIHAPVEALPRTTRWFILMLGAAAARHEHARLSSLTAARAMV